MAAKRIEINEQEKKVVLLLNLWILIGEKHLSKSYYLVFRLIFFSMKKFINWFMLNSGAYILLYILFVFV